VEEANEGRQHRRRRAYAEKKAGAEKIERGDRKRSTSTRKLAVGQHKLVPKPVSSVLGEGGRAFAEDVGGTVDF